MTLEMYAEYQAQIDEALTLIDCDQINQMLSKEEDDNLKLSVAESLGHVRQLIELGQLSTDSAES
jgi:hypothetical protein